MRWLLVMLLVVLPAHADESPQETVTLPRDTLQQLYEEYVEMRDANNKLIRFHKDWQVGTGCT